MEIINLPDKEFKVMIIKMFNKFRRRTGEHSEYNKVLYKKNQTELKNTITEIKIH